LGDRGRPDRIREVWQRAQEEDASATRDHEDTSPMLLPPGVAELAEQGRATLISHYDGVLLAMCRQADEALKSRYKKDFDSLSAERSDMEEQLASATASVVATDEALNGALEEIQEQKSKLAVAGEQVAALTERVRGLEETARSEAIAAAARFAVVSDRLAAANAAEQAAGLARSSAEATAAAAEREAERLREQTAALIASIEMVRRELADAKAELAAARATADAHRETLSGNAVELERVRAERDVADGAARLAAERAGGADQRACAAEDRAKKAETEIERLRAKIVQSRISRRSAATEHRSEAAGRPENHPEAAVPQPASDESSGKRRRQASETVGSEADTATLPKPAQKRGPHHPAVLISQENGT
jgi:chromosome segregation ATPase